MPEPARERRHMGRFGACIRAQLVIDCKHSERSLGAPGPVMGEREQGEGVAAAGNGKPERAAWIGRKSRNQRVKISPEFHSG